jgi:CelD/BcsL family acetyltransferase involved in cellulose biosynthesis
VAPFLSDLSGEFWCTRSLTLPIHPHIRRTDILCGGDHEPILEAIVGRLRESRRRIKMALHVRTDSPTVPALRHIADRHGLTTFTRADAESPVLRIDGDWEAFLNTRSKQRRSEIRRQTTRLTTLGAVRGLGHDDLDGLDEVFVQIVDIERRSWKAHRGESIAETTTLSDFYREIARGAARRRALRINMLYFDDAPIAHIFGVVHGGTYYALKTSYVEERRDLSPGVVLFGHALQDAFDAELKAFDFLGEDARWKRELATELQPHAYLCVASRGSLKCSVCHTFHGRLKPRLKSRLPGLVKLKNSIESKLRRHGVTR